MTEKYTDIEPTPEELKEQTLASLKESTEILRSQALGRFNKLSNGLRREKLAEKIQRLENREKYGHFHFCKEKLGHLKIIDSLLFICLIINIICDLATVLLFTLEPFWATLNLFSAIFLVYLSFEIIFKLKSAMIFVTFPFLAIAAKYVTFSGDYVPLPGYAFVHALSILGASVFFIWEFYNIYARNIIQKAHGFPQFSIILAEYVPDYQPGGARTTARGAGGATTEPLTVNIDTLSETAGKSSENFIPLPKKPFSYQMEEITIDFDDVDDDDSN
jgi:hypothetical protein